MPESVQNDPGYSSLIEIVNLWRFNENDPAGEIIQTPLINASTGAVITTSVSDVTDPVTGQIVTGEPTITGTCLASAIRTVLRKMRNISSQQLIFDNMLFLNLPPMDSPTYGVSTGDPTVQVSLGPYGFNDGVQSWPNFLLPGTVMNITEVWERISGSDNPFHLVPQASNGLPPLVQSAYTNGWWETRGNILYMNGCLNNTDIRLRGWMQVPTKQFSQSVDYTQTYVPILDCADAVAAYCSAFYDRMQGSGSPESMQQMQMSMKFADDAMEDLLQNQVRQMQGTNYNRHPYGGEDQNYTG